MKHYGIQVKQTPEKMDMDGKVYIKFQPGGWMVDSANVIFCTTSNAHAKAQVQLERWKYPDAKIREFES